jgi:hypothetical protein
MLFTQDRQQLRAFFSEAWRKAQTHRPLEPLEAVATDIIREHPELHGLLMELDALQRDYRADQGEGNPFLHLSLHIALHEQVATDRPEGMHEAYRSLMHSLGDAHEAQHRLMEPVGWAE